MKTEFSPLELDVVTELTNIGVGKAAAALSALVGEEIRLNVPECAISTRKKAAQDLLHDVSGEVVGVREAFKGAFQGYGLLLFPKECSLELVRCLVPNQTPLEYLSDVEQDALIEVGNIILNACIGTFGNILGQHLVTELPHIIKGECHHLLSGTEAQDDVENDAVVMLNVTFAISFRNVKGYVIFLMDLDSEENFRKSVQNYTMALEIAV